MDASVRETFRQQLLDLRRELQELEALSADASKPVQLDQSMVGRLSRIDAMQGAQMAQESLASTPATAHRNRRRAGPNRRG